MTVYASMSASEIDHKDRENRPQTIINPQSEIDHNCQKSEIGFITVNDAARQKVIRTRKNFHHEDQLQATEGILTMRINYNATKGIVTTRINYKP